LAFQSPLVVTPGGVVIDGYERWELARQLDRHSLPCIAYDLTEDQALQWLIHLHERSSGLNDFCRILLALDLEPVLREAARANQRAAGEGKLSSNLTEAHRRDVRQEIAKTAQVSVGNVSKVKEILAKAVPEVVLALKNGDVRVHRAWQWTPLSPAGQRAALQEFQSQRGVRKAIRGLVSRHKRQEPPIAADITDLTHLLRGLESGSLDSVSVSVIDVPGRTVFLTKELFHSLEPQKEFQLP
jgi:hypothetical protein